MQRWNGGLLTTWPNQLAQLQRWLTRQLCLNVRWLEFCARWLV